MTTLTRSTALRTTLRERKCVICSEKFKQARALQKVCSPACAATHARRESEKADRKQTRERKAALKTRSEWMREAQAVFNQYIRLRDQLAGHACISSGKPLDWSGNNVDAGHYRSRGSAPHLRFDERNCHAQSKQENRYASGNVTGYRIGLIARIGLEAVEALECDQAPRDHSIPALKAIISEYKAKLKALRARDSGEAA